jgi:hypothetical protein
MALTLAKVEKIAQKLRKLPDPPATERETTKQEAVRLLEKDILGLQRRGYTLEQIVRNLKDEGLNLSAATLKSYLSRARSRPAADGRSTAVTPPAKSPRPERKQKPTLKLKENEKEKQKAKENAKEKLKVRSGKDAFLANDRKEY